MAQLVEQRLLQVTKICSSNPVGGNFNLLSTVLKKQK